MKKRILGKNTRPEIHGEPTTGRIVRIVRGQGHGFVRAKDGREVFFHRADVEGREFHDLAEGDKVVFELVEDVVSGARALRLSKAKA